MHFMDLLYTRYANPMELVNSYINRGRFGEFVRSFLDSVADSRKEEVDRDEELKLWIMYCHITAHGFTDESYIAWKTRITGTDRNGKRIGRDTDLSDDDIEAILQATFPD